MTKAFVLASFAVVAALTTSTAVTRVAGAPAPSPSPSAPGWDTLGCSEELEVRCHGKVMYECKMSTWVATCGGHTPVCLQRGGSANCVTEQEAREHGHHTDGDDGEDDDGNDDDDQGGDGDGDWEHGHDGGDHGGSHGHHDGDDGNDHGHDDDDDEWDRPAYPATYRNLGCKNRNQVRCYGRTPYHCGRVEKSGAPCEKWCNNTYDAVVCDALPDTVLFPPLGPPPNPRHDPRFKEWNCRDTSNVRCVGKTPMRCDTFQPNGEPCESACTNIRGGSVVCGVAPRHTWDTPSTDDENDDDDDDDDGDGNGNDNDHDWSKHGHDGHDDDDGEDDDDDDGDDGDEGRRPTKASLGCENDSQVRCWGRTAYVCSSLQAYGTACDRSCQNTESGGAVCGQ